MLKKIADNSNPESYSNKLRKRRFNIFLNQLNSIYKNNISILDVGGTYEFWELLKFPLDGRYSLSILNKRIKNKKHTDLIQYIESDATAMDEITNNSFDIVFSNSVIEHVGNFEKQKSMAKEIRRISSRYFIQTPNKYFPIEPHFLFPFFQFLPRFIKAFLIRHFNLGWYNKVNNVKKSYEVADEIRLLSKKELTKLFPEATIYNEKVFGLIKSFIIYN